MVQVLPEGLTEHDLESVDIEWLRGCVRSGSWRAMTFADSAIKHLAKLPGTCA